MSKATKVFIVTAVLAAVGVSALGIAYGEKHKRETAALQMEQQKPAMVSEVVSTKGGIFDSIVFADYCAVTGDGIKCAKKGFESIGEVYEARWRVTAATDKIIFIEHM